MEGLELICLNIITAVGSARSCFIEAIQKAKENDFIGTDKLMEEGERLFREGHHIHTELIQQEAGGNGTFKPNLLLIHSEDQLMSAESFKIIATEFIEVYRRNLS